MKRGRKEAAWAPGANGALVLVLMVAALVFFYRDWATDAWLARSPGYGAAVERYARMAPLAGDQRERLLAGRDLRPRERLAAAFFVAACDGDIERVRLLHRLRLALVDPHTLVACAICQDPDETVDWMAPRGRSRSELAQWVLAHGQPAFDNTAALPSDGRGPMRPLACALERRQEHYVSMLLAAGALPTLEGEQSDLHRLAAAHDWPRLRQMQYRYLQPETTTAVLAALDAAARKTPYPASAKPYLGELISVGLLPKMAADAHGRNIFHWAAAQHDLELLQELLRIAAIRTRTLHGRTYVTIGHMVAPDAQGAQPWMHLLRSIETGARPADERAITMLRLLLPPAGELPLETREGQGGAAFPPGWTAAAVADRHPAIRAALGTRLAAPDRQQMRAQTPTMAR